MKKILLLVLILPLWALGQTATENYIKTTTYKGAGATLPKVQISYFDGLGRAIQQVAVGQSATGKNIVTPIEYDAFGRQVKEYMPYSSGVNDLEIVSNPITDLINFYQTDAYQNTLNPYSEKRLEASPLNRVLEQAAPGNDWSLGNHEKHTIRFDYQTNTVVDSVKRFTVTSNWDEEKVLYDIPRSLTPINYEPSQLYKTITKDENWVSGLANTTEEFKDKEGRVVLKRTYAKVNSGTTLEKYDTYYLYDQYGNLTFVLPPLVDTNQLISNSVLEGLCYQYKYDYRNRLVEKKLPGKQWEFILYDKLDRVVATGPAYSPFIDQQSPSSAPIGWMITKYDCFNRPVYTGWTMASSIDNTQRKNSQSALNNLTSFSESKTTSGTIDGIPVFYTNAISIIPGTFKLLTVSYYDNYDYPNSPTMASSVVEGQQLVYYNNSTRKPKGLPTGSWERILQSQNDNNGHHSYTLYDNKSRPVKSSTANYLGGYTEVESKIDFSGKTLQTITRHKRVNNDPEIRTDEVFTYSDQDRLLTHTHQINGGTVQLLSANTYNEMGQLHSKNVGGTTTDGSSGLQKVDYTYNIRGWLTGINDTRNLQDSSASQPDLFAFKINYNTLDNNQTDVKKLYNGNIAETRWRTDFDNLTRSYGYTYDALNRLTNAQYVRPSSPSNPNPADVVNTFNEKLSYDKNGNIQTLIRNGGMESQTQAPLLDNLAYQYDTTIKNKLIKVTDATANTEGFKDGADTTEEYGYDPNGNMTRDDNKNIQSIVYNHLNLPTKIVFQNGGDFPSISYLYTATGKKVAKTVNIASRNTINYTVDYLDGYQYESGKLLFFPTAEGYVKYTYGVTNPFDYVFNYTDHLGNIRLSYAVNPSTGIVKKMEENNYYPFGLKHGSYNTEEIVIVPLPELGYEPGRFGKFMMQKIDPVMPGEIELPSSNTQLYSGYNYKYSGKELQDELGLNLYDYGARNYDPAIGRWMNIDPLAEKYFNQSPYIYAANNPVVFVDYDGRDYGIYIDFKTGTVTIRGTYYTTSKDKESATNATSAWNDLSGKFSYNFTDENGDSQSFKINYELSVSEVTPNEGETEAGALNRTVAADTSGEGNAYRVLPDNKFDSNTNGATSEDYVTVRESKRKANTGKHEVGHSLGVTHAENGLMTATETDLNRTSNINSGNVSNIVSAIGSSINQPNKANKPLEAGAGRATLHLVNTNSVSAPKTDKGYRKLRNGTVK